MPPAGTRPGCRPGSDCDLLGTISPDFRADFREFCPRCSGTGQACLAARVRETAGRPVEEPSVSGTA